MSKQFIVILAVFFAVFAGILFMQRSDESEPANSASAQPTSHYYGLNPEEAEDPDSVVTLTEYGDFQCPACASYYPLVKQIAEKYKNDIAFEFKNFPIVSNHPNAMAAHRAAEAAGLQGKFWEMHDMLYQQQQSWSNAGNPAGTFRSYAESLELDMERYDTDVSSREVNAAIQEDMQQGEDLNVQGTPGFVLDGQLIENPRSIEDFERIIEDAIAEKTTG
ncbi:MAG: DsbA family protein [Candidatus Saccharibacteria bacterium]|nr:DsbA family protein [Candidatus Saccharibacteria bacterium]